MSSNVSSPLIEAVCFQILLSLKSNQFDNHNAIDYERFQDDVKIHLQHVEYLEEELDNSIDNLAKEIVANDFKETLLRDAREQIKSLESLCRDLRSKEERAFKFQFTSEDLN